MATATPSTDSTVTSTERAGTSIWTSVDLDLLSSLTSSLEEHVMSAACIDIIADARRAFEIGNSGGKNANLDQWLESNSRNKSNGFHRLTILRQGLEAASILMFIMTSSGIDRRVISEDTINACISLMRHHLYRNVIPALSNTGHTITHSPSNTSNSSSSNQISPATLLGDSTKPPQRKRQKTATTATSGDNESAAPPHSAKRSQALVKFMKQVSKKIFSSIGLLALLMERIDLLIQAIPLDDQPLLSICSTALSSLTIIFPIASSSSSSSQAAASLTNVIQMASLALVTTVFRQYARHRIVILEDLFPLFLKLPTSKKSLRTFPVSGNSFGMGGRRESQYGSLSVSSSASSCKRRRSVPVMGQTNIQVMSALIILLVQSCVTMPLPKGDEEKRSESSSPPTRNEGALPNLTSGLVDCESVCQFFTAQLIQRCSKKGEEGGASEFRPILSNLVEDLLNAQTVPDFPAAEMILLSICRRLSYDLISNSSVGGGGRSSNPPAEGTYLTTAMDTIGTICSDIASKIVASRENPLEFPKAVDVSNLNDKANLSTDSNEVNKCFCGRTTLVDTFMLDCDRCHSWFHGTCVGVAKDDLPEVWMCDECTMQLLVLEQTKLFTKRCDQNCNTDLKKGEITEEDQAHMMKILLLNFLSNQAKSTKSSNISIARKFHLAKFIKDVNDMRNMKSRSGNKNNHFYLDTDILCAHLMDVWHLPDTHATGNNMVPLSHKCEYLSEEGNAKLMLTLYACQSNNLASSFPRLLGVLLSLMGDERTVSLRKLAVKAVSQVVKVDSSLMSQPKVRAAVARRFQDAAISVREAAITLVGIYVLQVPSLANVFHRPLTLRLSDDGISVRKRAIKIFRDLMLSNPAYSGRADACTQMLQRAADPKEDDGVRDLIHESFQTLWFDSNNKSNIYCKTTSAVVTPGSDVKGGKSAPPNGSYETAKQMVEVMKVSSSPEYLTSLVKDLLFGFGEGDKSSKATARKERQFIAQKHCSTIVTALIEQLITYEEQRAHQDTLLEASELHLVGLISTLGVFAEASPGLLLKDLDVLIPYLKVDNSVKKESEALIVLYVCKILCRVSSHLSGVDIQRLSEGALSDDLVKITYNFGSNATSAAIEALVKLASHEKDEDGKLKRKLLKLAGTFFSYLTKVKGLTDDFSKAKASVKSNVHRALSALGSICRFHDKEADDDPENTDEIFALIEQQSLTWENVPTASYALFDIYIRKDDTQTKCKALRAMAGIFLARPRIMLAVEQHGLIEDVMSNTAPVELQLEALQCWREILTAEETRIESGEAKRQMESNKQISLTNQISGDQDSDASLIGACCIQHASRLFEMTASTDSMIRLNSLLLIETLLRQGLINPMDTVPHLLALQGDIGHPDIRAMALKLLIEENQKRPDIIRQRLASGVRRSYQFQRKVYTDTSHVTALVETQDGPQCIFGQIFKDAIRSSRLHRFKFLQSLLGLFTNSNKHINDRSSVQGDNSSSFLCKIPLLCFAAEIIVSVAFFEIILCILFSLTK